MTSFAPRGALVSVGGALLRTIGLSPQRITRSGLGRVVVTPTFGGNDIQLTGTEPDITTIEAMTVPQVTGGLDALSLLRLHKDMQNQVPLIRLSSNFLGVLGGTVVVTELESVEERLSPHGGVGRIMTVTVTLTHVGGFGWLSSISPL